MTVKEMMARLAEMPPDAPLRVLDGNNGAGVPREINLGPSLRRVKKVDIEESVDCENLKPGSKFVVIGYGCY